LALGELRSEKLHRVCDRGAGIRCGCEQICCLHGGEAAAADPRRFDAFERQRFELEAEARLLHAEAALHVHQDPLVTSFAVGIGGIAAKQQDAPRWRLQADRACDPPKRIAVLTRPLFR